MNIRHDQLMELNEWASNFVKGEPMLVCVEEVTRVYPDGRRETLEPRPVYESSVKREKIGELCSGTFKEKAPEEKPPLYKYAFPDGRVYVEKMQAALLLSGLIHFPALQDGNGNWIKESLWADEIIGLA